MTAEEIETSPPRAKGQHRRAGAPPARRGLPRLTVVLLLLCLIAAGFAAYFAADRGAAPATPAVEPASLTSPAAAAATAAAKRAVVDVLSYSYRSIDADVRKAEAESTGLFLQQYRTTANRLLSEARQEKAIVQATVANTGVVSSTARDVVVLLFVDQATVRQPRGPSSNTARIDQSRVRVTMTKVGSRWLISQLAAL